MPTYQDIKIAVAVWAAVFYWIALLFGKNETANSWFYLAKAAILAVQ